MEEMNIEEMRQQMAILKHKLEAQEIVTDRMIREATKTKVKDINSVGRNVIICGVFCLVAYPVLHFAMGFAWPFVIATCLMMVFCIMATAYFHRPLHNPQLMNGDLATVAHIMARFKHQYDMWLRYVTPTLLIPWVIWASYEFARIDGRPDVNPLLTALPVVVGAAIGGFVGYRMHRKAVRTAEEIIRQFEE